MAGARPLRKLGVIYEPRTVLLLRLVEASANTWTTVWLADRTVDGVPDAMRLLRRTGHVVDITGLSIAEIVRVLQPLELAGVIAFEDADLTRAAQIGAELGLPFSSVEAARRLTDKIAQRDAFRAAGIATPRSQLVSANAEQSSWVVLAEEATYPAILKPLCGTGSRNVYAVNDGRHLLRLLQDWPERRLGAPADMVLEERLADGWSRDARRYADYVTVESFASHGRISHAQVTGRMPMAEPFRQTGSFITSNLEPDLIDEITCVARQAIAAIEPTVGVFHTEVKVTPDGPRVVEVNGRVGGGGVPDILRLVADLSMLNLAGQVALGEDVHFPTLAKCPGVGFYYRYQPPLGARQLVRLDGIAEISHLPGIREVHVNRQPGDRVDDWEAGSAGYLFSILGTAQDHESMWRTLDRMHEAVSVEYA